MNEHRYLERILQDEYSIEKLLEIGDQFGISEDLPLKEFIGQLANAVHDAYEKEEMPNDGSLPSSYVIKTPELKVDITDPCDQYSVRFIPVADPSRESCMKTYREIKKLGAGVYGRVVQVCEGVDCDWALKIQRIKTYLQNSPAAREIAALRLLQDVKPQLVPRLKEYWVCDGEVYIVMQLLDMTFEQWLLSYGKKVITIPVARRLKEICQDLAKNGVLHSDLKPDNLLIKFNSPKADDITILVSDLGFASIKGCSHSVNPGWFGLYCDKGLRGDEEETLIAEYNLWQLEKSLILLDNKTPDGILIDTPTGKKRFSEVGFPVIRTSSRKLFYENCDFDNFVGYIPKQFEKNREKIITNRTKAAEIATAIDRRLAGIVKPVISGDAPDIGYPESF